MSYQYTNVCVSIFLKVFNMCEHTLFFEHKHGKIKIKFRHMKLNKNLFFHMIQGVKNASLLVPWDEVSLHIIKYITCEGRHSLVLSYHFKLLV
jgi:hypothetical protein